MRYNQEVLSKKDGACPSGGIGRRTGLKILRDLTLVPVQVRPWAPFKKNKVYTLFFFLTKKELVFTSFSFFILSPPPCSHCVRLIILYARIDYMSR